jgi:hypothetical protein
MDITKPLVGGSSGSWGSVLNTALDAIVTQINKSIASIANKLPLDGGTLTGRLIAKSESMVRVDLGSLAGGITFDLSDGNYFTVTCTAATTWTFDSIPAGALATGWIVKVTNGGAYTIAFAAGGAIHWPGGVMPTLTVAGTDTLVFITDNDGATIRASVLALNQ